MEFPQVSMRLPCQATPSQLNFRRFSGRESVQLNQSMTRQAIKELANKQPFKPFSLRLVDGTVYEVPGRDYISLSISGASIFLSFGDEKDSTHQTEVIKLIDTALVSEAEYPEVV
jgi:hypothetical protein